MYAAVQRAMEELNLDAPATQRCRNPPACLEQTPNPEAAHNFATHEDKVRKLYFEALDLLDNAIEERFSHPGLQSLLLIEKVLLSSVKTGGVMDGTALQTAMQVYSRDFVDGGIRLQAQLRMLPQLIDRAGHGKAQITTVPELVAHLQTVPKENLGLFTEVVKLVHLLLVCPASVATAERSFSDLRRLKTWLRSSISQSCTVNSSGAAALPSRPTGRQH